MAVNTDQLNRTVFISDNLPFLRALDSESVDLVVIDPPFGKQQTFSGNLKPPLSDAELEQEYDLLVQWGVQNENDAYELGLEFPDQTGTTATFRDIWDFRYQVTREEWDELDEKCRPARMLIEAARYTHSDSTAGYIAFMTMRMLEIRRVLKDTGSVYLHCDHNANAYLRQMMDAVFGQQNFANEIVWKRTARGFKGSQHKPKQFNVNVETIPFYKRTPKAFFDMDRVPEPYADGYLERAFKLTDGQGRYYLDTAYNRPSASPRPNLCYEYKGLPPPHPSGWKVGLKRMKELDAEGELVIEDGELCRKIRPKAGRLRNSLWDDISEAKGKESTNYPTQKPQALARRMIEASSNPGDLVLDCFAGCAYVPVAAELTGRRWIACDMSPRAWTVVRRQFHKQPDLRIETEGAYPEADGGVQPDLGPERIIRVRGPHDLPEPSNAATQTALGIRDLPEIRFRQRPLETRAEIWDAFVAEWGTACWYCGQQKAADPRELPLDHVEPNRKDGSNDDCWNRALSCSPCNSDKSNRMTPEETIHKAREAGRIATDRLMQEQIVACNTRLEWAKDRWEQLPRQAPIL